MNTDFITTRHRLILRRFPEAHNPSLQAWDAADEYLLEHLASANTDCSRILILNDGFGALGCALASHHPTLVTDSHVSALACRANLAANALAQDSVELLSSLDDWPPQPSYNFV